MRSNSTAGHLASLLTIIIWGTTFISTKILLADFHPIVGTQLQFGKSNLDICRQKILVVAIQRVILGKRL